MSSSLVSNKNCTSKLFRASKLARTLPPVRAPDGGASGSDVLPLLEIVRGSSEDGTAKARIR
jgi:hypothetical protein